MVPLTHDGSFFRAAQPVFCPLFGAEVPVCVYTGEAEVHPDQSDALTRFPALDHRLL